MHPRIHWFISDPSPVLTKKESVAHYRLDSGDSLRFDTDSHISIADSLDIVKDKYSNVLKNQWTQSLPVDGGSVPGAAPERSPADLDGAILVRTRTCTNYIHQIPLIKVLRSFFKSDRSPRSPPRSPHPPASPRRPPSTYFTTITVNSR